MNRKQGEVGSSPTHGSLQTIFECLCCKEQSQQSFCLWCYNLYIREPWIKDCVSMIWVHLFILQVCVLGHTKEWRLIYPVCVWFLPGFTWSCHSKCTDFRHIWSGRESRRQGKLELYSQGNKHFRGQFFITLLQDYNIYKIYSPSSIILSAKLLVNQQK